MNSVPRVLKQPLNRLLAVGALALGLVTAAGCPTAGDAPEASQPQVVPPARAYGQQTIAPSKPPVAESQQPAAPPPSEPLSKPVVEPIRPPAEPPNPLRDGKQAPVGRPLTGKTSGEKFDPIKANGPIFVGWPKPKAVLVITGMEEGYLEPCGCAGLDRMKGGMSRRATFFAELRRKKGWPVVGLDVGGLVQGFGEQAVLKFRTLIDGKCKMGYDAVAFGADDLRLPASEVLAVAAGTAENPSMFVAANVGVLSKPGDFTPQSKVIEAGGMKIGVTAVLGKQYQQDIHNDEIEMSDPAAALEKIVPELKQKADYLVLLAHAPLGEAIELGRKFPALNAVVCSDGPPEPPATPQAIKGMKTLLITVGYKGQNAVVLGLFDDADHGVRYQRVPLDSRFPASPDMKQLMAAYQETLKDKGFAGLALRPVPHPLSEANGRLIGSKKCQPCHEKSYDIWKRSGHGRAYDTLVKLDPPRNFDPECVSCHVTGWNPGKFFPYVGGYESREKTPHLIDAGCEDCHGPGEKHAAAEIGADEALQKKLRKAMVITKAESKKQQCYTCHDLDNSPDFDFDKYWPFVEHYEKE